MIYVLNGPNLGRLGTREPAVYGSTTHDDLVKFCQEEGARLGQAVQVWQTDAEHEMLSWLYRIADEGADVILNAGAWTHYNYAVRDACAMLRGRLIEVHISNVHQREEFRHKSVISGVASGVIVGLGIDGYRLAIEHLARVAG
jgi:3-dehydroquinate dehydratase-2